MLASSKTGFNSSSDVTPKISNTFSISGILQDGHGAQLFETKFLRAKKKSTRHEEESKDFLIDTRVGTATFKYLLSVHSAER